MKILVLLLLNVSLFLCGIPSSYAACTGYHQPGTAGGAYDVNPVSRTISFPSISTRNSRNTGDQLTGTVYLDGDSYSFLGDCRYPGGYTLLNMTYGSARKSNVTNVYQTNVSGVGIVLKYGGLYFSNPGNQVNKITYGYPITIGLIEAYLVQTGPITPGVINPGEIGYVSFDGSPSFKSYTVTLGTGVPVTAASCSLNTQSINIKLDDITDAGLVSVGTTAKLKNFDIGLDCEANAQVNVQLTGTQNSDTTAAGVLQLTNAGSAGVAKGVGIQMLYDNKPMALNQKVLLKTSAGGLETFTFGAQYYKTKAVVSSGSANATATLDITYQ